MEKMRNSYKYLFGNPTVNVSHLKSVVIKSTYWRNKNVVWIYLSQERKTYKLLRTQKLAVVFFKTGS